MTTRSATDLSCETAADGLSRADRTTLLMRELQRHRDAGADEDAALAIERIVEVNMEVAKTLARRYYGHGERSEDLDQTAYLALTKAARRFDPGRGRDFLAFAVPTILGELRRHFRDACWMVRPPRRVQELQGRLASATEAFAQEHGRTPDPQEIAEMLGAKLDDVVEALTANGCFSPSSLDRPLDAESTTSLGDTLAQEELSYERVETHQVLRPLIEELPERERRVIELRFFRDWTQEQIGQEIGVTQMQVSRILSRIMKQLQGRLTRAAA